MSKFDFSTSLSCKLDQATRKGESATLTKQDKATACNIGNMAWVLPRELLVALPHVVARLYNDERAKTCQS